MSGSESLSPKFCRRTGSAALGGSGDLPGMMVMTPEHSLYAAPAQLAWHLLAYRVLPSSEHTGKNTCPHFLTSHLSQDPFEGTSPASTVSRSKSQTASQIVL